MRTCEVQLPYSSCCLAAASDRDWDGGQNMEKAAMPFREMLSSNSSSVGGASFSSVGSSSSSSRGLVGRYVDSAEAGAAGVYSSMGTVEALTSGAAARLRWLLTRGVLGEYGGLWWRRDPERARLD